MNRASMAAKLIAGISVLVVAAAVAASLYLFGHKPAPEQPTLPASQAASSPQSAPLPTNRNYLGVFERGAPGAYKPVEQFAAVAGAQPSIAVYYSGWNDAFQAKYATAAAQHGAVVLVQMLPRGYSMASIAAGRSDGYLRSYARSVRSYGHPVILSFAPEPDGPWYSWGWKHTSAAEWVAAWRHVVTVFRQEGAVNVTWLWDVNRETRATGSADDWWPGRRYVTWAGIDGYYFTKADTFSSAFGQTIADIRKIAGVPLLLSEVGVGPGSGPDREAQIADLFAGVKADRLLGLIWFDVKQNDPPYHQDWRLEDDPAALAAFRAAVEKYERRAEPVARIATTR